MSAPPSSVFGYKPEYTKDDVESLQNVNITSKADGEVLTWDATQEKWVNGPAGGPGNVTTAGMSTVNSVVRVTGADQVGETGVSIDNSDNITGANDADFGGDVTVTGTMGGITATERAQLANIDATTISTTQWGYLGAMDQGVATTDTPTFTGLDAGSQKITNVATPTATGDAVNLGYLDDRSVLQVYNPSTLSFANGATMVLPNIRTSNGSNITYNQSTGVIGLATFHIYHVTLTLTQFMTSAATDGIVYTHAEGAPALGAYGILPGSIVRLYLPTNQESYVCAMTFLVSTFGVNPNVTFRFTFLSASGDVSVRNDSSFTIVEIV